MTKAGDGSHDLVRGLGPDHGLRGGIVVVNVVLDGLLQISGATENAAAELLLRQRR